MSLWLENAIKESDPEAQAVSYPCQRGDFSTFHYTLKFLMAMKTYGDEPCSEIKLHSAAFVTASWKARAAWWLKHWWRTATHFVISWLLEILRCFCTWNLTPQSLRGSFWALMMVLTQFTVLGFHFKWQKFSWSSLDSDPEKHPQNSQWAYRNNNLVYDNWTYWNICIIFEKGWKVDNLCSPAMDPEKFGGWRRKVRVLKCPFQCQAFWWWPTALSVEVDTL